MTRGYSTALKDYWGAFKEPQDLFLFHYSFNKDRPFSRCGLNRGEFWSLAKKAAFVIKDLGCRPGDCVAHCFGSNHAFDLVFRLAATLTGTVPVTVNWQADTIDRIFYKIELTESKLVITDSSFSRENLEATRKRFPRIPLFRVDEIAGQQEISEEAFCRHVDQESTKIIVFTSGTTGNPRGAELPYRCYRTNQATFEQFLEITPQDRLAVLIVNPLHHANSTAICDWAMRRPGSHIHLIEKYSTEYWKILTEVNLLGYDRLIAPTVSRHFDFLENLARQGGLPVESEELKRAMKKTDFLIGSAPVGPTII
jgi:acyl-CoA synthetase (AMP-forming)/AMP-acid ligase II